MDALSEDSIVTRAHQCWSINEIVVMIVSHLLAANLHGSASALARTSRSLFLSTVPELWREQRSVRALLRLVPQEVFRALRNYMKATSRYWTVSVGHDFGASIPAFAHMSFYSLPRYRGTGLVSTGMRHAFGYSDKRRFTTLQSLKTVLAM